MPIRRHHRWLYPIDWRELSASIRFRRAKGRCETCGRPHGHVVLHLGDGRGWDDEAHRAEADRVRAALRREADEDNMRSRARIAEIRAQINLNAAALAAHESAERQRDPPMPPHLAPLVVTLNAAQAALLPYEDAVNVARTHYETVRDGPSWVRFLRVPMAAWRWLAADRIARALAALEDARRARTKPGKAANTAQTTLSKARLSWSVRVVAGHEKRCETLSAERDALQARVALLTRRPEYVRRPQAEVDEAIRQQIAGRQ